MTFKDALETAKAEAWKSEGITFLSEILEGIWSLCDVETNVSHIAVHPSGAVLPLSRFGIYNMNKLKRDRVMAG